MVRCSFVDYPGGLAAVVFVPGCNLRCHYCHNPDLVRGRGGDRRGVEEVLDFLDRRRGRLDAVVVSGGEPCLDPGLPAFLGAVRERGFVAKLDTNGTRPGILHSILDAGLLDYVAMDLKDLPDRYDHLGRADPADLRRSIALIRSSGVDHEFRTTVHLPRFDRTRILALADELAGVRRWYLQRFREGEVLEPTVPCQPPSEELVDGWCRAVRERGIDCRRR